MIFRALSLIQVDRFLQTPTASSVFKLYYYFSSLFLFVFSSHSRIFHSFEDVTIAGEGLQILTYARHFWPLSSEGSLACYTCCDTGHPFMMVISDDTQNYCRASSSGAVTTCLRLRTGAAGIRTPNFPLAERTL